MMIHFNVQNKEVPPGNYIVSEELVLLIGKTCLMIGKKAFFFFHVCTDVYPGKLWCLISKPVSMFMDGNISS